MTEVIWVKVYNDITFATDSITTVALMADSDRVYNDTDKILHLHRRYSHRHDNVGIESDQIRLISILTV